MSSDTPMEAVRVHLASSDVPLAPGGQRRRRAVYQTVTLTADDPVQPVLPDSSARKIAFLSSPDQAFLIGNNRSDVGNGLGTLVPANTGWPVDDHAAVFAAPSPALAGSTTARIGISATYEDGEWQPSR